MNKEELFIIRWGFAKIVVALILLPIGIVANIQSAVAVGAGSVIIAFICFAVVIARRGLVSTFRDFKEVFRDC
jgi:choline-glycine betaine transporter